MIRSIRPGLRVRSTYRARWVGVVLEVEFRHGSTLALVRPLLTYWGAPQSGPGAKARWIGVAWLEVV